MLSFVIRRILTLPLIMLAVTFLIVLVMQLIPPEQRAVAFTTNLQQLDRVQEIIKTNHLDGSVFEQYWLWLGQVLSGNLGFSRTSGQPVTATLLSRIPSFVLGVWLLVIFYGALDWLPGTGNISNDSAILLMTGSVRHITGLVTIDALLSGRLDVFWDGLRHLILPSFTLLVVGIPALIKGTRASMIEALHSDYIRTARAKGISERVVIHKHARRNAMLPVATLISLSVSGLLQGAVLAETLYGYPGVGAWDAQAAAAGGHPRALGNFTRLLGHYVRERGLLSLEEGVRRMTSLPAEHLRLKDRGELREGAYADVVIFDPATIQDKATYAESSKLSVGVQGVWVNGVQTLKAGKHTGALPGKRLYGPGAATSGRAC